MRRPACGAFLALLVAAFLLAPAAPAGAHEEEQIGGLTFVVGWGDEPAHAGFKNSVQVVITQGTEPVTDIGDLRVDVAYGDQTTSLALEPNFAVGAFGEPGDYRAWLTPTRPGTYAFRLVGSVGAQAVDQLFTSGPDTFSDVIDPAGIQFPVQDPTPGQLAERVEREAARTAEATEAVEGLAARTQAAEDAAAAAEDDVASTRTLAIVALAVAVLALGSTAFVLLGRRG